MLYPDTIIKQNDRLRSELGNNPLYAWRWTGDLKHVMVLIYADGSPKYVQRVTEGGLIEMLPETETRLLLPEYPDNWALCVLTETNESDGKIAETGSASWCPISSSNSGPVVLPHGELPTMDMTMSAIGYVRKDRERRKISFKDEWEEDRRKREKAHWNKIYDQISNESAAFCNVPGKKGHVSFPLVNEKGNQKEWLQ